MAINALLKILKADQIKSDVESLKYYGKDWTTYFDIKPLAIVFPESTEDLVKIVNWARAFKIGLVPSGGRTGLSGAACATNGEAVISFERMNQLLEFSEVDQTVKVQAGYITESLQQFAKSKDLFYPVDFAARGSSQIGGNIATNAGGIKVLRYGLTRDWIVGLKVVTGSGEILDLNNGLVKNATGYDLRHLFIGSEGTLGFIVEATIKLAPPPPNLQVLFLGCTGLQEVMQVFSEFKRNTVLTAFEMLSDLALNKVMEVKGLSSPLQTKAPFYVVLEIEAPNESSEAKVMEVFETCLEKGLVADGAIAQNETQAKTFWRLREDISESLSKYSPYKNDIAVKISKVPDILHDLDLVLTKNYPTWEVVWFGHIGDGNLHINILRPEGLSKEEFVKQCQGVDQLVFECIKKQSGSISAEHGVGLTKKPFLTFTRSPEEIRLMTLIKRAFDPDNIINPGKLL